MRLLVAFGMRYAYDSSLGGLTARILPRYCFHLPSQLILSRLLPYLPPPLLAKHLRLFTRRCEVQSSRVMFIASTG